MHERAALRTRPTPAHPAGGAHPPAKPLDKPAEVEYIQVVAGTRLARLLRTLAQHGEALEGPAGYQLVVDVKGNEIHASIKYVLI